MHLNKVRFVYQFFLYQKVLLHTGDKKCPIKSLLMYRKRCKDSDNPNTLFLQYCNFLDSVDAKSELPCSHWYRNIKKHQAINTYVMNIIPSLCGKYFLSI